MIFLRSHNQTKIYENSWCPPEARSAVLAPLSVAREGIRDSDFTKIKVGINFKKKRKNDYNAYMHVSNQWKGYIK